MKTLSLLFSLLISTDVPRQNADIDVGFALYDNDVFFQSKSSQQRAGGTAGRVISGSIAGVQAERVDLKFRPLVILLLNKVQTPVVSRN